MKIHNRAEFQQNIMSPNPHAVVLDQGRGIRCPICQSQRHQPIMELVYVEEGWWFPLSVCYSTPWCSSSLRRCGSPPVSWSQVRLHPATFYLALDRRELTGGQEPAKSKDLLQHSGSVLCLSLAAQNHGVFDSLPAGESIHRLGRLRYRRGLCECCVCRRTHQGSVQTHYTLHRCSDSALFCRQLHFFLVLLPGCFQARGAHTALIISPSTAGVNVNWLLVKVFPLRQRLKCGGKNRLNTRRPRLIKISGEQVGEALCGAVVCQSNTLRRKSRRCSLLILLTF